MVNSSKRLLLYNVRIVLLMNRCYFCFATKRSPNFTRFLDRWLVCKYEMHMLSFFFLLWGNEINYLYPVLKMGKNKLVLLIEVLYSIISCIEFRTYFTYDIELNNNPNMKKNCVHKIHKLNVIYRIIYCNFWYVLFFYVSPWLISVYLKGWLKNTQDIFFYI